MATGYPSATGACCDVKQIIEKPRKPREPSTRRRSFPYWLAFFSAGLLWLFTPQRAAADSLSSTNLVQNGTFETGTIPVGSLACPPAGWSGCPGKAGQTSGAINGIDPTLHGHYGYLAIGTTSTIGYVSQTINTTAGQSYLFSFQFSSDGAAGNQFVAKAGSTTLMSSSGSPFNSAWTSFGPGADYGFLVTAAASTTTIAFGGEGNGGSYVGVDGVSLVSAPATAAVDNSAGGSLVLTGASPISILSGALSASNLQDSYTFQFSGNLQLNAFLTNSAGQICANVQNAAGANVGSTCGNSAGLDIPNLPLGDYTLTVSQTTLTDPSYSVFFQTPVDPVSQSVPEPSSLAVLATGLLGIVFVQRRKRRG